MIDAAFRSMAAERSTPSPCYAEEPDLLTSEPLIPDMNDPSDILTDDHRRLVSLVYHMLLLLPHRADRGLELENCLPIDFPELPVLLPFLRFPALPLFPPFCLIFKIRTMITFLTFSAPSALASHPSPRSSFSRFLCRLPVCLLIVTITIAPSLLFSEFRLCSFLFFTFRGSHARVHNFRMIMQMVLIPCTLLIIKRLFLFLRCNYTRCSHSYVSICQPGPRATRGP